MSGLEKILSLGNDFDSIFPKASAEAKFLQLLNDSKMGDFTLKTICLFSLCPFLEGNSIKTAKGIEYHVLKMGIFEQREESLLSVLYQ